MEVVATDLSIPPRRALKRSASTASLPTPPRTRRRRDKRTGRLRGASNSDSSESEGARPSELSSSDDEGREDELPQIKHKTNKKRRLSLSKGDDGNEEAFWLAPADKESSSYTVRQTNVSDGDTDVDLDADDLHHSVPLVYRKISRSRSQSTTSTGLVSPPLSHRKTQSQTQAPITPPAGDTPGPSAISRFKAKSTPNSSLVTPRKQRGYATRSRTNALRTPEHPVVSDSPDNPFYVAPATPSPGTESESPRFSSSPQTPKVGDSWIEKPTVTYVFRGVRKEYQNPLYNHAKNKPLTPPRNSKLPLDHPDYSPDMSCKPTILFPTAHAAAKRSERLHPTAIAKRSEALDQGLLRRSPRRGRTGVGDSDNKLRKGDAEVSDEERPKEDETFIRPRKLDFGAAKDKPSSLNRIKKPAILGPGAAKGKEKELDRTVTRTTVARTMTKAATSSRVGTTTQDKGKRSNKGRR